MQKIFFILKCLNYHRFGCFPLLHYNKVTCKLGSSHINVSPGQAHSKHWESTGQAQGKHEARTGQAQAKHGASTGKNRASTGQALVKQRATSGQA